MEAGSAWCRARFLRGGHAAGGWPTLSDGEPMAKAKRDTDETEPDTEPAPAMQPVGAPKVEGERMVLLTRGGPYTCHRHDPTERKVGGGAKAMKTTTLRIWPGGNYRTADTLAKLKGARGFEKRKASREIQIFDKWMDIPRIKRLEAAKLSCDPATLPRLVDEEKDDEIFDILKAQHDIAKANEAANPNARNQRRSQNKIARGA